MKTEELLKELGVSEEKYDSARKALNSFLDGAYVPKSRFNEVNEEKKTLSASLAERDKQLEGLKTTKGSVEELTAKIKALQEENKKAMEEASVRFEKLRLSDAIKMEIMDTAQDVDIVAGLFDQSKIVLGKDGKLTGLDEQLANLEKTKPFLFKKLTNPKYDPAGGGTKINNPFARDTYNLTEQGRMLRENPAQAKAMAAAAGVKI